jgi:hypothetical protein
LLLGILAVALISVGCGGGRSDSPAQIPKREFVEKGSAICVATRKRIRSDFEVYTRGKEGREVELAEKAEEMTPEEAAGRIGRKIIVPAMKRELEEFQGLGIPEGDEDQVDALLRAFEEGVEKADAHPERAATTGTEAFGTSGKLASEYGLRGC